MDEIAEDFKQNGDGDCYVMRFDFSMCEGLLVMSSVIETSGRARLLFFVRSQISRLRFATLEMTEGERFAPLCLYALVG